MGRSALLFLFGLAACSTDYDLTADKGDEDPPEEEEDSPDWYESGDPAEESGDPGTDTNDTEVPSDLPIAVCSVSPASVRPIVENATWQGGDSYDPEGQAIVNYRWSLVSKPTGSAVNMPSGSSANRSGFNADLAGDYVGRLVVETSDGRASEPCETTLTAIPVENLWIELYWQYSDDDLDLHLVRPGGSLLSTDDCYYANCVDYGFGTLDWGTWGVSTDDPSLDLDDIPGTGPENVNIEQPENGTFTVYVHDYQYSTNDSPSSNTATVNIYIGGSLAWTGTKTFTSSMEDDYVPVASINWPAGTVSGL